MATAVPSSRLYRPHRPERTLLYRVLADQFERFLGVYEERFEPTHGYLRRSVERAVYRYLDCGIFAHGAARAHCAECGHDFLIAFFCKLRCLCPSCHQKRELLWVEWASHLLAEAVPPAVLGVPHRQVVFTVPKRLRIFFRFDPLYDRGHSRKLLGELPGCAWRALRLYFSAWFEGVLVEPGAVGFLQTAGEFLGWHPHLHVLLTDGGWLPDGTFRHLLAFDSSQVEKLFRAAVPPALLGEVLRLLVARGKISGEVVDNLLTWRHPKYGLGHSSGFSVHAGVRVEERSEAVRLGRHWIRYWHPLSARARAPRLGRDLRRGRLPRPARAPGRPRRVGGTLDCVPSLIGERPRVPRPGARSPPIRLGAQPPGSEPAAAALLGLVQQRGAWSPAAPAGRAEGRHLASRAGGDAGGTRALPAAEERGERP